jgi:hypothetical protein
MHTCTHRYTHVGTYIHTCTYRCIKAWTHYMHTSIELYVCMICTFWQVCVICMSVNVCTIECVCACVNMICMYDLYACMWIWSICISIFVSFLYMCMHVIFPVYVYVRKTVRMRLHTHLELARAHKSRLAILFLFITHLQVCIHAYAHTYAWLYARTPHILLAAHVSSQSRVLAHACANEASLTPLSTHCLPVFM